MIALWLKSELAHTVIALWLKAREKYRTRASAEDVVLMIVFALISLLVYAECFMEQPAGVCSVFHETA